MLLWHIPWHVINREWTDEQFNLMFIMAERRQKAEKRQGTGNVISEQAFIAKAGSIK